MLPALPPASPRRPSRWLRRTVRAAALALVLGVASAAVGLSVFAGRDVPLVGAARLAQRAANQAVAGHVRIAQLRWRVPFGLSVHGLEVADPYSGTAVLRISQVRVRIGGRALLQGRFELVDGLIDGLEVQSGPQTASSPSAWARAFAPAQPQAAQSDPAEVAEGDSWWQHVPVSIRSLRLQRARIDWTAAPRAVHAEGLALVVDAAGTLHEGRGGLRAEIADLAADGDPDRSARGSVGLGAAELVLRRLEWRWDGRERRLSLGDGELAALGSQATLSANFRQPESRAAQGAACLRARVPLRPLVLLGLVPAGAAPAAGQANVRFDVSVANLDWQAPERGRWAVDVGLRGESLQLAHLPVASAQALLRAEGGHIEVRQLELEAGQQLGRLRAQGAVDLLHTKPTPAVGAHWLGVEVAGLQTQRLMARVPALRSAAARDDVRAWLPHLANAAAFVEGTRGWPQPATDGFFVLSTDELGATGAPLALRISGALDGNNFQDVELTGNLGALATLEASGAGSTQAPYSGHANLQLDVPSLARLTQVRPQAIAGDRAHLVAAVEGDAHNPTLSGRLWADGLRWREGSGRKRIGALSLPFRLHDRALRIDGATLRGPSGGGRLEAAARWPRLADAANAGGQAPPSAAALPACGYLDAELRLDHLLVPMPDGKSARVEGSAVVSGPLMAPHAAATLHLHGARGPAGQPVEAGLLLEASRLEVQLVGLAMRLGQHGLLRANGRYQTPNESEFGRSGKLSMQARGRALPLPIARGSAPVREVALSFDADVAGDLERELKASLNLQSLQGFLAGSGTWQAPAQGQSTYAAVSATLRGRMLLAPLGRMLPSLSALRPGGQLALQMTASPGTTLPVIDGQLHWRSPRLTGQKLQAGELHAALHGDGEGIAATLEAARSQSLRGRASWQRPVHGAQSAEVWLDTVELGDLYPPFAANEVSVRAGGHGTSVQRSDGWHTEATLARMQARAGGLDLGLSRPATLVADGHSARVAPFELEGSAGRCSGDYAAGEHIEAAGKGRLELGFMVPFVPALRHADGAIALGVAASGPARSPRVTARLDITRPLSLAPQGMPSEVQIEGGHVVLRDDVLSLTDIAGHLDGGSFAIDGHLDVPKLVPNDFAVRLRASHLPVQAGALVFESNIALRAHGNARGPRALVRGDIDIVGGRFLRKFELRDFNFLARKPNLDAPLEQRMPWLKDIDLNVRAKNKSGFDVRVDAGTFAMATTLESDVHIGGNALAPIVNGKVAATEGSLQFPHGTLVLHQAELDFDPSRRSKTNALGADINLVADGEVTPLQGSAGQSYDVSLRLDGDLENMVLDLSSGQGLSKMSVLALLTTGYADISDLTQGGDDAAKLDAAIAFAGAQVSEPLTSFAQRVLERRLNLRVELGTEVAQGNVRVTAAKNVNRRLRLETAYSHGITGEQSNVSTRAQLSVTDRLMLEGRAARDLTGTSATTATSDHGVQSNLELKLRLLGH